MKLECDVQLSLTYNSEFFPLKWRQYFPPKRQTAGMQIKHFLPKCVDW
jgi:hypothetical protein